MSRHSVRPEQLLLVVLLLAVILVAPVLPQGRPGLLEPDSIALDTAASLDTSSLDTAAPLDTAAALPDTTWTRFIDLIVRLQPVHATLLGIHDGDGRLGPAGESGLEEMREAWGALAFELETRVDSLSNPEDRFDVLLMLHEVHWRLFELDTLRVFARDPRFAVGEVARGIYGLLAWDNTPIEDRVRSLIARLDATPAYLEACYRLLENPPRVLVDHAIGRSDVLSTLILNDIPAATASVVDTVLTSELSDATEKALRAVWWYREQLLVHVLPTATEEFALGTELFVAQLRASEGITTPVPVLRSTADAEIERLGAEFRAVASRIDSTLAPTEVMFQVSLDHPPAESILVVAREAVAESRSFVMGDSSFPQPGATQLEVRPTPEISRWAKASLAAPGPFEPSGFRGVFYVTLPAPGSSEIERGEHLRFLSRSILRNLAVHEAYPGHGLQAEILSQVDRPVRRAVLSSAFMEGWAHYTETLVLERGYREGDEPFRLATLQSALRRAGRFRVSLGLHTEGWTVKEATDFLEERAYLEPSVALGEAERGMVDPMYLVYTLGRLELESLRGELERRDGEAFDLGRFHRSILELGAPPLPLLRARLLSPEVFDSRFLD